MWVGRWGDTSIGTLAIDPADGSLSELGSVPVGGVVVYLSLDRIRATCSPPTSTATRSRPGRSAATGAWAGRAGEPMLAVGTNPHSIVLAPAGDFAFVPHLTSGEVRQFRYDDADGSLEPNDPDRVMDPTPRGRGT